VTTVAPPPAPAVPATVQAPTVPWTVALPAAVVAGVVLDVAFPSVGAWGLAFPAVAAALVLARGRGLWASWGVGVLFGLGFMVPQLQWSGVYVGALPWLALATMEAALLALVLPGWTLAWRTAARAPWTLPLTAGAAWVAAEALRARVPFGGFGWGRLGFSQADSPLRYLASVGGVPLVSFAVVALAATAVLAVVMVLGARDGAGRSARQLLRGLAAPVALVLLLGTVVAYAAVRVDRTVEQRSDRTVRVAAVQGDVPRAGLDFNAQRRAVLDNHVRGTLELADRIEAGEEDPVDLVLWPENASDIDPLQNEDAAAFIGAATDAVGVPVLVGAVLRGPGENLTNAVLVWDPGTGYRGRTDRQASNGYYAKQALAPFGEYIPYRPFFRLFSPLVDTVTDFAPGDRAAVLQAGGASVGTAICFEVLDDETVRAQVLAGADLLVVPTNNATFGFTDENVQQLAMSRLRAVEHGRDLVHISNVGTSTVVSADGTTGRRTALFEPDVLVEQVQLRSGSTLATLWGPAPELALVAVALLLVLGHGVVQLRREGVARP
jgi:apolipoprotein N-acyltransferase